MITKGLSIWKSYIKKYVYWKRRILNRAYLLYQRDPRICVSIGWENLSGLRPTYQSRLILKTKYKFMYRTNIGMPPNWLAAVACF